MGGEAATLRRPFMKNQTALADSAPQQCCDSERHILPLPNLAPAAAPVSVVPLSQGIIAPPRAPPWY